jgi:acetyl esterase/lipase
MWSLQHVQYATIRAIANTSLYIKSSSYLSPSTQPDIFKTDPTRPHLYACRIFLPKSHRESQSQSQGQEPKTLPLIIRAHGGGFVVNAPAADDILARRLSDTANCLVVSLDYSKSPQNKFPAAYEDVIAQSLSIIEDSELPIDKSKVILCGSSAGGNLLLAASSDPRLRSKLAGVISIYPVVDFAPGAAAKMATRPDPSVPDFIGGSWDAIQSLYLPDCPADQPSMDDPRLSPAFFSSRQDFPPEVLLIGAEHDMFCAELGDMAEKLAAGRTKVGLEGKGKAEWKAEGVRWYKVLGQAHAFEGFKGKTAEAEEERVEAVDGMVGCMVEWVGEVVTKGHGKQ